MRQVDERLDDVLAQCKADASWGSRSGSWPAPPALSAMQIGSRLDFLNAAGSAHIVFEDDAGAAGRSEPVKLLLDGSSIRVQGGGLIVDGIDLRSQCTWAAAASG